MRKLFALTTLLVLGAQARADGGVFVGSTPCGAVVRRFLALPRGACNLVRWQLSLGLDADTSKPGPAAVEVEYGVEGRKLRRLHRSLRWEIGVGIADRKDAHLIELHRGKARLRIWKVDDGTLYLLDARRRLLAGDSRFGYALSFAVAEKIVDADPAPLPPPESPYEPTAPAKGPGVHGVFEGRTPCDVATILNVTEPERCATLRWRLTLFQDPKTHALTRYKLEGTLFGDQPREGIITPLDGTPFDPLAKVLKLELPSAAHGADGDRQIPAAAYLMRGDHNEFFLLDRQGKLNLGTRDANYVLSRR